MKRNTTIDILRLVFALIIMLHHSRYFLGYDRCVFAGGSLAVEFFFIVSGFLMAKKAAGPGSPAAEKEGGDFGTARFLLGKLDAVLPEMLAGWLIGFAVIAAADSLPAVSLADKLKEYLWEPLMLRMTGIYTGGFNGVTWYISSMLLCMAVLYPLTRRYPDMMTKVAAPMISLLLLGYLCRNFDHPREPSEWLGFTFKGNIRAMAEISLGIAAYRISARISRIEFRRTGEWLITIAESALYFAYILYMFLALPGRRTTCTSLPSGSRWCSPSRAGARKTAFTAGPPHDKMRGAMPANLPCSRPGTLQRLPPAFSARGSAPASSSGTSTSRPGLTACFRELPEEGRNLSATSFFLSRTERLSALSPRCGGGTGPRSGAGLRPCSSKVPYTEPREGRQLPLLRELPAFLLFFSFYASPTGSPIFPSKRQFPVPSQRMFSLSAPWCMAFSAKMQ